MAQVERRHFLSDFFRFIFDLVHLPLRLMGRSDTPLFAMGSHANHKFLVHGRFPLIF
jgi:hypothetical protein